MPWVNIHRYLGLIHALAEVRNYMEGIIIQARYLLSLLLPGRFLAMVTLLLFDFLRDFCP
jgi:hypothetical protein